MAKDVKLLKRFDYDPKDHNGRVTISYPTIGKVYKKIPDIQAAAMVKAGCGEIVGQSAGTSAATTETNSTDKVDDGKRSTKK